MMLSWMLRLRDGMRPNKKKFGAPSSERDSARIKVSSFLSRLLRAKVNSKRMSSRCEQIPLSVSSSCPCPSASASLSSSDSTSLPKRCHLTRGTDIHMLAPQVLIQHSGSLSDKLDDLEVLWDCLSITNNFDRALSQNCPSRYTNIVFDNCNNCLCMNEEDLSSIPGSSLSRSWEMSLDRDCISLKDHNLDGEDKHYGYTRGMLHYADVGLGDDSIGGDSVSPSGLDQKFVSMQDTVDGKMPNCATGGPITDLTTLIGNKKSRTRQRSRHSKSSLSAELPPDLKGVVGDSIALVKLSNNPYEDFRESMYEMILERDVVESMDVEKLLHCYMSLNSPEHHKLIKEAYSDVWSSIVRNLRLR